MKILKNKKMLIGGAAVILVIAFLAVGVASCSRASYYQLALDNLSEARFYMKQDESTSIKVQFYSGMRENPYEVNGISEENIAFGIINIEPKDKALDGLVEIEGTLNIDSELVPVKLEKNPYGINFACDIERLVDKNKEIKLTIEITKNGIKDTIIFNLETLMPSDAITWEDALKIATDHLASKIKKAGKFECYVKIISDLVKGTGSYWYIQFVTAKGDLFFCVVDTNGNVIGKK